MPMVEQAMFFALGFLVAGFIAVLLAPALSQRAERLANRRMRALFPVSIEEMAAERDHLRAEHAVMTRRMERRQERLQEEKAAALSDAGKQLSFVNALKRQLGDTRERLSALEASHTDMKSDHDAACAALATTRAERDKALEKVARLTGEVERLTVENTEATRRVQAQREAIAELEQRLGAEMQAQADNKRLKEELAVERSGAATLREAIAGHRANATRLGERMAVLEKEREASRDADRASAQLSAEIRTLRERLTRAQQENDALRHRLAAATATASHAAERQENATATATVQQEAGIAADLAQLQADIASAPEADADGAIAEALRSRIISLADHILQAPASPTSAAGPARAEAGKTERAPRRTRAGKPTGRATTAKVKAG